VFKRGAAVTAGDKPLFPKILPFPLSKGKRTRLSVYSGSYLPHSFALIVSGVSKRGEAPLLKNPPLPLIEGEGDTGDRVT